MSALNNTDILITFDELRQLNNCDISSCIDKNSVFLICERGCAPPSEVYNVWVQKLLKAYDPQEFSSADWQRIIELMENLLGDFIQNLNDITDNSCKLLEQWLLDTQYLIEWLKTIVNVLNFRVLSLILAFVLEIVIKTYKFVTKGSLKLLCNIQQLLLNLINNSIYKTTITNANDFESFHKVVSSLCDVGSLISSADIKTSLETWRALVKLSEKFNNYYKQFPVIKIENGTNTEKHWFEKAILGIFKELKEILLIYKRNPTSSNDNLLQVAQFYLKILRLLINYSKEKIKRFPAAKEFIEVYTLCHHKTTKNENPKLDEFTKKGLTDIFLLIHREDVIEEILLQHIKNDVDNFETCNIVLDFLQVSIENCSKNRFNNKPHTKLLLKLYNLLFEGPLIFIDSNKYSSVLQYFVSLIILDVTNELHSKLCEYVVDLSWIRSYTSMEILNVYYSLILNPQKNDTSLQCLEFWLKIWNKLNKSTQAHTQHKMLIEFLLKTILNNINDAQLQTYNINKFENIEIILLKCDKQNEQCITYLETNLMKNLKKMQERHINGCSYRDLINLLEICALKYQLVNHHIIETLLATFTGLFSLPANELHRFRDFLNICFRIFWLHQDKQLNEKLLTFLIDHEQHCCHIQSIFLIEFLLKHKPQSNNLLQIMKSGNKETNTIINLIDKNFSNELLNIKSIDLKLFKDLPHTTQQSNAIQSDLGQIKKKLRLDQDSLNNIKFILNDLNLNSQKLLSFERSTFDEKDFKIMQAVKNNIEKCLKN